MIGRFIRRDVLLLRADEAPNFINLEPLAAQTLKDAVLIPSGGLASVHNELADGRLAHSCQSGDGADRHALAKKMEDFGAGLLGELVHCGRISCCARSLKHKALFKPTKLITMRDPEGTHDKMI